MHAYLHEHDTALHAAVPRQVCCSGRYAVGVRSRMHTLIRYAYAATRLASPSVQGIKFGSSWLSDTVQHNITHVRTYARLCVHASHSELSFEFGQVVPGQLCIGVQCKFSRVSMSISNVVWRVAPEKERADFPAGSVR
jgi:hypothetical protein